MYLYGESEIKGGIMKAVIETGGKQYYVKKEPFYIEN